MNYVVHPFSTGIPSGQSVATRGNFSPPGICLEKLFGSRSSGEGCYWLLVHRGRDAAKHPTMHRTAPAPTKNDLPPCVNSAVVKKSCFRFLDYFNDILIVTKVVNVK